MGDMRAMVATAWGGPEVLEERTVPRPEPGEGEVLVRVRAAGVNPVDHKTRASGGLLGRRGVAPPVILGWDVAGTVEAVGPGVTAFAPGDEVFGMPRFPDVAGAYAEYVAAPADTLARIPAGIDHAEAAALPLVALTVLQAFAKAALADGASVLVHAAAGGVGHVAVQVARARGCRVAGTASAANQELLRELGVDTPVDYGAQAFEEVVRDVDVVLDPVGGEVRARSWGVLRPGGVLVSVVGPPKEGEAEAHGARGAAILVRPSGEGMAEVARLVESGALRPVVSARLPLSEVAEAHRRLETGHGRGKVVLEV
jgi:NADPH:quinone reductase-like Zn-dependent oxidoreductase